MLAVLLLCVTWATPAAAQVTAPPPSRLAEVERTRSRRCVATLSAVAALDVVLDPLAQRSRRLLGIAEAIALEDRTVTGELDPSDALESDVRAWFATDSLLAVRFVASGNEALQEQRAAGRTAVQEQVRGAMEEVQTAADSILAENEAVLAAAGPCDGAIFVRPAVVAACDAVDSDLCRAAAAPPEETTGFLFVDDPSEIWSVRDLRPWTPATPLQPGPSGLDGGRTIGYARVGNVVLTAAFSPLLRPRSEVTRAEIFQFEQTNQALALTFEHPDIVFTPALALRAALPERLADEDRYVLHFGSPDEPDVLWEGPAGTGAPLEASLPLSAAHVLRLRNGDAVTLTAMRGDGARYSIGLSTVEQATFVSGLLRYMAKRAGYRPPADRAAERLRAGGQRTGPVPPVRSSTTKRSRAGITTAGRLSASITASSGTTSLRYRR